MSSEREPDPVPDLSADIDRIEDVDVDVDVVGDSLEIVRRETESVRIDCLFQPVDREECDAQLILWSDSAGWSGFERRGDSFHHVHVLVDTVIDGADVRTEREYIVERAVNPADVAEAIHNHIEDPKAGGAGNFARGCSPP
ncbi:hypothetical protein [Haloparvum sedimenti]|uniref:hypothetical protein n=1 Tax=Haloparvum sedimenti TaxID=1678448 RepID=UPI00071E7E09|nr:hypothetical protein [Haloparvum sedimenti]